MMRFIAGIFENGNKYTEQARKSNVKYCRFSGCRVTNNKIYYSMFTSRITIFLCGYFEKLLNNLFLNKLQYFCFKALQYCSSINCLK